MSSMQQRAVHQLFQLLEDQDGRFGDYSGTFIFGFDCMSEASCAVYYYYLHLNAAYLIAHAFSCYKATCYIT
jgi:hypothetical protein